MTTLPPWPEPSDKHGPESRRIMGDRFILEAREELRAGNRIQAGEKAWGVVVQYYKVVAESRGWEHSTSRHLESIGRHLIAEFPEFATADFVNALSDAYHKGHHNFYENRFRDTEMVTLVEDVESALPALRAIIAEPPRPFTITSNSQLRRLRMVTGNDSLQIGDESPTGFSRSSAV